ncbi:MAG: protein kinase [Polyangiaceae bacterium]|nr:protein kinase [Polyangiaceae bacterium]MCL4753802.1 serine/threonine protein kinase [Myxococcales bacterium]
MSPPPTEGSDSAGSGSSDERVGTVLSDRYRLDSLLGEGGMGKVYAAEHVMMRKRLAVKVLHRELTAVPEVVARFEREAMAAANIEHPNVAAATDFGKLSDGSVFLVLEFVQGRNLRDEIAQGPMGIERALSIARQIASGLAAAHALDIVHRDLKPENVMLVEKGGDPDFVKVLDFGIAKVPIGEQGADGKAGKPITKVGMVFGTPEYMAPEQALGQSVDGRADVYALGVMLYEMLAGVRPFSSKSPVGILGQQLSKNPPSVGDRVPGLFVPPAVEHLLQHLLAREASERVQTAGEVVAAIDALLGPAPQSGARLFTMTAGSPPSSPVNLRVQTIPDLDEPVPVLVPPDAMRHMPSSPGLGPASSPGIALIPAPESFQRVSSPDALEADLEEPSVPSIAGLPRGGAQPDRFRAAVDDIVHKVKHGLAGTFEWIDAQRPRLPPAVREPLGKVPTPALLGASLALLAGGVLVFVLILGALIGGGRGKQAATTPSATASGTGAGPTPSASASGAESGVMASDDELAAAKKAGVAALSELAAKYPKDVRVLLAAAKLEVADKKHTDAVGSIGKALGVDPSINENPEVASVLWTTAQAKDSTDATFALLEGPMGSRGADMMHDLATTEGVRREVRQRADRWLGSEAFQKRSTPALNVLVALEKAKTCRERYALLLRAKNQGDERTLALLRSYEKKSGCGKKGNEDCNECMRSDKRLEEAVEAVKARSKT